MSEEYQFQPGDRVRTTYTCSGSSRDTEYVVDSEGKLEGTRCDCQNGWKLVKSSGTQKQNMNLLQQFKLSMKGEPEKTFIKAGIIDNDEAFTPDGKVLFNAFLLKKHGAEFKKEVVDPLLAEREAEAK